MALILETAASDVVNKLANKPDLVDIMIDIEDYLDSSNLYVFDNWIKGVLVKGPMVQKYWIDVTFKYDFQDMPDPDGGLRLTAHGTKIRFQRAKELRPLPINNPGDYEPGTHKPRMKAFPVWLVHMRIPRRFVEAVNQDLLDQYDDEAENSDAAVDAAGNNSQMGGNVI
jgi:hypothetical protein